jgi:hypothetical protein
MRNSIVRHIIIVAASAGLLASTAITSVIAQETQGTGEEEIIKKKPGAGTATETAPGQQQKTGEADSAKEVAPGQQQKTGEADSAKEAAPGQQQQQTGETEQQPAPGQQEQKTGESEQQPAPGQQEQKTGESEQQPAPGQQEQQTGESEQQPSTETTGSIDINTEQKTEITQVFREVKTEPVEIDIDVNVGVVVPRTVTLRPLPPRVIEIVPAYRGYEYFVLADGRIIIVGR